MAERTFEMSIRSQSIGNITSIAFLDKHDRLHAHLQSIPVSLDETPTEAFDPAYMGNLFQFGNEMGAGEQNWMMENQNCLDQS